MKNKAIIIYFLLLCSCHSNKQNKSGDKKIDQKDLIISYLGDSNKIKLGEFTKFQLDTICYANKTLQSIGTYIDTVKNGYALDFYKNGNIKHISLYKNGILNGWEKQFDDDGQLNYLGNYYEGKQMGSQYFYYKNGKLQDYCFFNGNGEETYRRSYDSTGNLIKDIGYPISEFGTNFHPSRTYHLGDTVHLHIQLARPPMSNLFFKINEKNNLYKEIDIQEFPKSEYGIQESYIMRKPGNYVFMASYIITDLITKKQTQSSDSLNIKVIK